MDNNPEQLKIEAVSPDAVYNSDRAAIDMQIITAKAYPRNITRATEDAIAIVSMDVDTARTCTYSVPRAGKAITGPSVHMARILAQNWGNLRAESKVVNIDDKHATCEAIAFDLEKNIAIKVQIKRPIYGKSLDMITLAGTAGCAIAFRNAIYQIIPQGITNKVYNAVKHTITGDISDEQKLISKRKKVLDGLKDTYKVTEEEILNSIGKTSVSHITGDDLVVLIGIGTAIKDGDTTVEEAFRNAKLNTKSSEDAAKEKEDKRIRDHIASAKTLEKLEEAWSYIESLPEGHDTARLYGEKQKELEGK